MNTRMIHPQALSPQELDAFLAQGWFRMRQAVFTCRYVMSDGFLRTAVWLRFGMEGHRFQKSLRRVLNRNDKRFSYQVVPASVDAEKEFLYAVYRDDFAGDLAPDLTSVLYDDGDTDIYHTQCVEVRDGDKLVACSFFDVGVDSIASIIGIFDPEYRRFGLGLYTMLVEFRYGMERGLSWFYPGYVAPGCTAFDYKLRLGEGEFFDPDLVQWRPYSELDIDRLPAVRTNRALEALVQRAEAAGHSAQLYLYPPYGVVGMDKRGEGFLTQPAFVRFPDQTTGAGRLLVTWDPASNRFHVELYARVRDLRRHFGGVDHPRAGPQQCHDLLRRVQRVGSAPTVDAALSLAAGPRQSQPATGPHSVA